MRFLLLLCCMLLALTLQAQEKSAEPPAPVPVMEIIPPKPPEPAPVKPSFMPPTLPTPAPATAKPAPAATPVAPPPPAPKLEERVQKAAEDISDLIQNPQRIEEAIVNAPQTLPKQLDVIRTQVTRLTADPNRFNGNNFEQLKWRNSLFFTPEQLERLYTGAQGLTDQSVGAVIVEVAVPRVAPAFYVNSVLYNGPDNWTIWLNSRRIRSGSSFPELEVQKVNADAVTFVWQTDQLDFISPGWEKNVPPVPVEPGEPVPEFAYVSRDNQLAVDRSRRYIRFTIGPHQTFVSRSMQIVEGPVESTFFSTVEKVSQPAPKDSAVPKIQIEEPAANTVPAPAVPENPPKPVNKLNPLAPPPSMLQTPAKP